MSIEEFKQPIFSPSGKLKYETKNILKHENRRGVFLEGVGGLFLLRGGEHYKKSP